MKKKKKKKIVKRGPRKESYLICSPMSFSIPQYIREAIESFEERLRSQKVVEALKSEWGIREPKAG